MSLFKRKKRNKEEVLKQIEEAEDLGQLATLLAKEGIIKATDKNHNTFGEELDHLDDDGELPWGWTAHKKEFIDGVDRPFYRLMNKRAESRTKSPKEQIKALEDLLQYINKTSAECKAKGECYEFYFQNYTLANGLQERFEKELKKIKTNYDKLAEDYNLKANFEKDVLPTLRKDLLQIIKDNPDIMQKDLYKRFQKEARSYISDILYHLDKDRIITREKSGNSYKLRMPK